MEKLKKILAKCLLAFALISIGFAFGKHSVKLERQENSVLQNENLQVAVYYLHSTIRCVTCNTIEEMTMDLLDNDYTKQISEGKIQWITKNFQENENLAEKFEVASSCVVVANIDDGEVIDYKRLDDVWTLMNDKGAFNKYISDAIDGYLENSEGES
ncbi:MAG: nitrophenyl compound nitroreductase subunit ArsF family protein [Candidatus Zixiibacteriota bacterium]